jgi:hypothetical protein
MTKMHFTRSIKVGDVQQAKIIDIHRNTRLKVVQQHLAIAVNTYVIYT